MKILISNDDGFQSKGIHALARCMAPFGDLTIVAPKYHQSAMSMSVSLGMKKLAFKKIDNGEPGDWYYLDATPASCVKFGLEFFFENRDADLVICGVNHGSNAATAANYSATLGAAEEGALNGCKAIGVSLCNFRPDADFSLVEKYLPGIVRTLLDNWPEDHFGLLYNINFPDVTEAGLKGIRATRQGKGHWIREFREWNYDTLKAYEATGFNLPDNDGGLEEGEKAYMMVGDFINDDHDPEIADHLLNDEGWITITPNNLDRTDYTALESIRPLFQ